MHSFECIRERKKHSIVRRAQTLCASSPCCRLFYSRRQISVSLKAGCVRRKICFKEIVLNTRLDLIHSSFTHLVCQFIIIWRFFFYIYSIYLLFLPITSIYVIAYIYICMLFLFVNHKSKLLKYIQKS